VTNQAAHLATKLIYSLCNTAPATSSSGGSATRKPTLPHSPVPPALTHLRRLAPSGFGNSSQKLFSRFPVVAASPPPPPCCCCWLPACCDACGRCWLEAAGLEGLPLLAPAPTPGVVLPAGGLALKKLMNLLAVF
jgi:hypothetical protein